MPPTSTDPADPWAEGRLHLVLAYAFDAHGRDGRVNANQVAEQLHVSPSTVRRWVRNALPAKRRALVEERILPADTAVAFEAKEYTYAAAALEDIYGRGLPPEDYWREQGWLEPHVLAVVELQRLGVCVPRIGLANGDAKTQGRLRADGGVILDQQVFPNRFAAQIAKGQILTDVHAWRVVVPPGFASRGRTEAWLAAAPRPPLSTYFDNAPVKPPAPKRRRTTKRGRRSTV